MSTFAGLYDVREGTKDDVNFVLATFLRGLYYGDSWFSFIPKDVFMDNYKNVAAAILKNPDNIVRVACLKDDPSVILGYSLMTADYQTVHWVFVKKAWRDRGIATALTPRHPVYVSHLTGLGKKLLPKLNGAVFNPFAGV